MPLLSSLARKTRTLRLTAQLLPAATISARARTESRHRSRLYRIAHPEEIAAWIKKSDKSQIFDFRVEQEVNAMVNAALAASPKQQKSRRGSKKLDDPTRPRNRK
jgi:hypothetical protein